MILKDLLLHKNILITGAGSGIGQASAIAACHAGAKVILMDISNEGLAKTIELLPNDNYCSFTLDITSSDLITEAITKITEENGKLNGIVHCAGISSRKPLNVLSKNGFQKVMDVNFFSFVDIVRIGTKKKNFEDGGSIIAMSSVSSIKGYKAKSEYCVSKAALDAFIRCMALELSNRKIRINSIVAAEVLTPLALKAKEIGESISGDLIEAPLGPTDPNEVANLITFLLSDATKTITGSGIVIDGGLIV